MKRNLRLSLFLLLAATLGLTQGTTPSPPSPAAEVANKSVALASGAKSSGSGIKSGAKSSTDDLQAVLAQMDQAAGGFNSAQGEFEYKVYQKVVDDMFVQKGNIYFRRTKKGVDAAFQ